MSQKLVLTPVEAARKLGIGIDLMYKQLHSGKIPHVKLGDRYLISKVALERWLIEASFKNESGRN